MTRNHVGTTTILFLAWFLAACARSADEDQQLSCLGLRESKLPKDDAANAVKLSVSDWTTSAWDNEIARIILREYLGIPAREVQVPDIFSALSNGDVDAHLELWSCDRLVLDPSFEAGTVVDGGLLGVLGRIGWYWPSYVVEQYPWAADIGSASPSVVEQICALANNTVLYGPHSWIGFDNNIIRANGYPLNLTFTESEDALVKEIMARYSRGETFLFYMWTPHWIFSVLNLTRLSLPQATARKCNTLETATDYSCDYPLDMLRKAFWVGLKTKNRDAMGLLSLLDVTTDEHVAAMYDVQVLNKSVHDSACAWVLLNRNRWMAWTIAKQPNIPAVVVPSVVAVVVLALAVVCGVYCYHRHEKRRLMEENARLRRAMLAEGIVSTPAERVLDIVDRISGLRCGLSNADREDLRFVYSVIATRQLDSAEIHADRPSGVDDDVAAYIEYTLIPSQQQQLLQQRRQLLPLSPPTTTRQQGAATAAAAAEIVSVAPDPSAVPSLDEWCFDALELQGSMGGSFLATLGTTAFLANGLFSAFPLNEARLMAYLRHVEAHYSTENPYHNAAHAGDVTQCIHWMLTHCAAPFLGSTERLALLFAGLVHDVEHGGRNNAFLVATSSPIAVAYNDRSVLENMHASKAFQYLLLDEGSLDFLRGLPRSTFREFRGLAISLILATDMARHVELLSEFRSRLLSAQGLDPMHSEGDRLLVMKAMVKVADLVNTTRPWPIALKWAQRILEENMQQGDDERQRGLAVSPMMDRASANLAKAQASFLEFVVLPLAEALALVLPELSAVLVHQLRQNHACWRARLSTSQPATSASSSSQSSG